MGKTRDDGWTPREDKRAAPYGQPQITVTGERFWVLRVNLYASPSWPVDCVTRLLIWEDQQGTLVIEHGKFWPETKTHDGADDGA